MTDQNSKPPLGLLDEYGLNEITYRVLRVARTGPIRWPDERLAEFTRQPAPALRKLVDRQLLAGPQRGEPIASKMFGLTASGLDILQRIERGLHRPTWLSDGRIRVLRLLADHGDLSKRKLLDLEAHTMSIISLRDAGYIADNGGEFYSLTDLGRAAWFEHNTAGHPGRDLEGALR